MLQAGGPQLQLAVLVEQEAQAVRAVNVQAAVVQAVQVTL